MALTLPYPSLDFVPLDILTAEEMNQIVANYEFIAGQFPITSDNIAWTTLGNSANLHIQTGEYTVPSVNKGVRTNGVVVFPTAFKAGTVPNVLCFPDSSNDANSARMLCGAASDVTRSSFHYWIWSLADANFTNGVFRWYAFGEKA